MSFYLSRGLGRAGNLTVSSPTIDAPDCFTFVCTAGLKTGTLGATYTGSNGDFVIIYQARGGGNHGKMQMNKVVSGAGSTSLTFEQSHDFTCTSSGAQQAFLQITPDYSGISITSSLMAKSWDGSRFGTLFLLCSGLIEIPGSLIATGCGFRGATSDYFYGEGFEGDSAFMSFNSQTNGNGGGAGSPGSSSSNYNGSGAGGGGNKIAGGNGATGDGNPSIGIGGLQGSLISQNRFDMGGGGGKGGRDKGSNLGSNGTNGGGNIILIYDTLIVTGSIQNSSPNSANAGPPESGAGAAGAGGNIKGIGRETILGTNFVTALMGTSGEGGTAQSGSNGNGGIASPGQVSFDTCSLNGVTNPTNVSQIGGFDFCSSGVLIY